MLIRKEVAFTIKKLLAFWNVRNCVLFIDFIASFSFYLFIPYLATYFSESKGYSVSFIGGVLAIRIIAQQGLAIWGGLLADRLGYKTMALIGFVIRGLGFIGMGYASNGGALIASAALSGLGGAFFSPALRATIAYYSTPEKQKEAYGLMNMVENAGAVLGPMFGMFLYHVPFDRLSILTGGLFLIMSLFYIRIPSIPVVDGHARWFTQISYIMKDKQFMFIFFGMIPFYFIHQQLYLSLPIVANSYTGSSNWIFPVVTILIIFFQMPFIKLIEKKRTTSIFFLSYLCMALLFIPLSIVPNLFSILLCLMGISLGTMILLPSYQAISVRSAPNGLVAAYLGFSTIAMAIGGTLGNIFGGALFDYFISINQQYLFWICISLLSLFPVIVICARKIKIHYQLKEKV
ncbi:MFS transporter [Sutcliffiella halmapala]|uniref:MFS transporter n=1 Tax=Sutcliffiella halmapala TaxID=79882 RepID=UPI00147481D7|nr:MFS transporter [Sutcliffiella halmapala]